MQVKNLRVVAALSAMAAGVALASACMQDNGTPASSTTEIRSSVETLTWSDGKPAYSVSCDAPGGCMQRSIQLCNSTFGNYQVLRSPNMPMRGMPMMIGDARDVRGSASVVIRCG